MSYFKIHLVGLCKMFVNEPEIRHQFVVRGAIAFGPVIHGEDIDDTACSSLLQETKQKILLGMPVSQAYRSERLAPPFGIYIHESARAFGPTVAGKVQVLNGPYYYWYDTPWDVCQLKTKLGEYFEYCSQYPNYLQIDADKIKQYQLLVSEYLARVGTTQFDNTVRDAKTE